MNDKISSRAQVFALAIIFILAALRSISLSAQEPEPRDHHRQDLFSKFLIRQGIALQPDSLVLAMKQHSSAFIRVLAASELGEFPGNKDVVASLLEVAKADPDWNVRAEAARTLHKLGNPEGLRILRDDFEKAVDWEQRLGQANRLAGLGDSSGFKAFEEAFAGNVEQERAIREIWPFVFTEKRDKAAEKLKEALLSKSAEIRRAAARGVLTIISKSPAELANWQRQLESLKSDPDPAVRQIVETALSFERSTPAPAKSENQGGKREQS